MCMNMDYKVYSIDHDSDDASTISAPILGEGRSTLEVDSTGQIRVTNTGGSSASEGGMGNDNTDDKAKGDLKKTGGKLGENMSGDESEEDTRFDPIKKNVREAEKGLNKD